VVAAHAETGAPSLGLSPVQRPRPRRTAWRGGGSPQTMRARKDLRGRCSPVFWGGWAVSISRDAPCGRCAAVWPVAYACFEFVTLSHAPPCLRRYVTRSRRAALPEQAGAAHAGNHDLVYLPAPAGPSPKTAAPICRQSDG